MQSSGVRERKRVLFVAHSASDHIFGGERSLLDLMGAVERDRYQLYAVLPRPSEAYASLLRRHAEDVVVFPYGWWNFRTGDDRAAIERFRQTIRDLRIDLVYANTIMLREPLLAARVEGVKCACHIRELIDRDVDLLDLIGGPVARIIADVRSSADFLICNSEATYRLFFCAGKSTLIVNGVDIEGLDIPHDISGDALSVGLLGNNARKKGVAAFFSIAEKLRTAAPNLRFRLIGPSTPYLRGLHAEYGARSGNIELCGYAADLAKAYAMVDIVLNLSIFGESFGRSVAEAMAARRPAVVYNHGALAELVEDGVTGYVVPYLDTNEVAAKLLDFSRNPRDVLRMGERARERAIRCFSRQRLAESLNAWLDSVFTETENPGLSLARFPDTAEPA
ncbi:MAG: glycosyltransferase family 4 protein [Parvibaculaceae bacterium]